MAGILKNLQCHPIKIGGADDRVHILSSLSKNIAFADMIGRVKCSSSKRLSEKGVLGFAWQNGDGAFSVSESSVEAVTPTFPIRPSITANFRIRKSFVSF